MRQELKNINDMPQMGEGINNPHRDHTPGTNPYNLWRPKIPKTRPHLQPSHGTKVFAQPRHKGQRTHASFGVGIYPESSVPGFWIIFFKYPKQVVL
jgi:hypothetical protein